MTSTKPTPPKPGNINLDMPDGTPPAYRPRTMVVMIRNQNERDRKSAPTIDSMTILTDP